MGLQVSHWVRHDNDDDDDGDDGDSGWSSSSLFGTNTKANRQETNKWMKA